MKLSTVLKLGVVMVFVLTAVFVFGAANNRAVAHEGDSQSTTEHADATYSYTAQPGDSYTKMARKAVQTYGLKEKINLSPGGVVFAETNLTLAAGSPTLEIGQKVEIKESAIHEWVDKASKLAADQQTAWNYYVQFVNFNTNNVGQPS